MRSVGADSFLLQERDLKIAAAAGFENCHAAANRRELELNAMLFGWRVVKHVKSNAIVYAGADRTLGIGAGQMSRVDSSRIAVWKAGEAKLSAQRQRGLQRRLFSVSGRIDRGGGSGRDGGDPAGRFGAGRGSDRGGGRAEPGDGVHRHAAFPALTNQPVNQNKLAEHDDQQERPDKPFAEPQAALPGGGEPELNFHGAERDDVAVAEKYGLDGFDG